jgi:2-octaprenyl-6-methoxyphenol hydroxylase
MRTDYDLLIIGGGLVGASLAHAVAAQGLRIGLVETMPLPTVSQPGYDDRSLALAYGSRRIFEGLELWDELQAAATAILSIHVSDRGNPGIARLDCSEQGVEALGYVIEAQQLGLTLTRRLQQLEGIELLCPAILEEVAVSSAAACARVSVGGRVRSLTARLLVAADGAHSRVRQQLGIAAVRWDYGQSAVIANVSPTLPHGNTAYERFTESGPLALLPMSEGRCALVCTVGNADKETVLKLEDAAFLAYLQERFGDRLGRFKRIGRRQAYPLTMVKAREHARHRVALIGNAAHTLHPVAGQGFNVGIRDVAVLAEVISDAQRAGLDLGDGAILQRYADWRRWDQRRAVALTDGLARLFSNPLPPLRLARNLGLLAFDLFPPAKRLLARQTMGLDGYQPRLARGLPLTTKRVS